MNIQEIPTTRKEKPRVCAYVRVSTDSEAQEDSFAFQSNYWQKRFASDESVEYVGLFSDEGIGGAFMKKRDGLKGCFKKYEMAKSIEYTRSRFRDSLGTRSS